MQMNLSDILVKQLLAVLGEAVKCVVQLLERPLCCSIVEHGKLRKGNSNTW